MKPDWLTNQLGWATVLFGVVTMIGFADWSIGCAGIAMMLVSSIMRSARVVWKNRGKE